MEYFSMAASYALQWYQTFENGMKILFSKTCQHCWLSIKMLFSMLFYIKIQSKAISTEQQLYPSVCFWTGKMLMMDSFTQLLYNAWTHFLFTRLRDIFKLSQIWILPLLQKVSSLYPEPSYSWIRSFFT